MQYAVFIFFFSNNLILNKASLGIFPCKWSAVAGVAVLDIGGSGSLPLVPRVWNMKGLLFWGLGGSGSTRSVLFGDIRPAGLRHMVGGSVSFFSMVRVFVLFFFIALTIEL